MAPSHGGTNAGAKVGKKKKKQHLAMMLRALYICKWSDVDLVFIGGTLFQIETTTTIHGATNLGCGILYKHRKVTWILMPSSFQLPKLSPEGRRVKTF